MGRSLSSLAPSFQKKGLGSKSVARVPSPLGSDKLWKWLPPEFSLVQLGEALQLLGVGGGWFQARSPPGSRLEGASAQAVNTHRCTHPEADSQIPRMTLSP